MRGFRRPKQTFLEGKCPGDGLGTQKGDSYYLLPDGRSPWVFISIHNCYTCGNNTIHTYRYYMYLPH